MLEGLRKNLESSEKVLRLQENFGEIKNILENSRTFWRIQEHFGGSGTLGEINICDVSQKSPGRFSTTILAVTLQISVDTLLTFLETLQMTS